MHGGDITRSTFDPAQHFSGVRMQQGRVQLDADWNEQLDLQTHRDRRHVVDSLGSDVAPRRGGGFALTVADDGSDLLLSPGRMWVGGTPCETGGHAVRATLVGSDVRLGSAQLDGAPLTVHDWLEVAGSDPATGAIAVAVGRVAALDASTGTATLAAAPVGLGPEVSVRRLRSYARQPGRAAPDRTGVDATTGRRVLQLPDGHYLAYLDVWQQTVTALDVPAIREKALGGPDTATRDRTVWQVRLAALPAEAGTPTCDDDLSPWTGPLLAAPTGTMAARAETPPDQVDLCTPTPAGGYTGLENHLYRVQVHHVDGSGRPHVVWSRDNASVVTLWHASAGEELTVADIGPDDARGFAGDQWVELTDDAREQEALPGTLVRLRKAEDRTLVLDTATADGPVDRAAFGRGARVRRWDCVGVLPVDPGTWTELEDGVQVRFTSGGYRPGDYWLVPARSVVADVDWPRDDAGRPVAAAPHGVEHRYAHLALVHVVGAAVTTTDCRHVVPSLATLLASDVAFDDSGSDLGVGDVQGALERLSRQRDLRRHHRLLHGWGIVCGLQVACGPSSEGGRRRVTVSPGSAIDSRGDEIELARDAEVDVMAEVERLVQEGTVRLDETGSTDVLLALDATGGRPRVRVEPYRPADDDATSAVLDGTLLMDFHRDYVQGLQEWVRAEFTPPPGQTQPVGPQRQLLAALANLVAEPVNPRSGRHIFVSPREDELLQRFYGGLRARLQSETYCAMFDGARTPEPYPAAVDRLDTAFGMGGHSRVRMRPGVAEAWTVGRGLHPLKPVGLINRYDLRDVHAGRLQERLDPVAGTVVTGASTTAPGVSAVSDVAFSPDGRLVHAAVPTLSEDNTVFRSGVIRDDGVDWGPAVTICGVKLVTLATTAADPDVVYGIGHRKVQVQQGAKTVTEWRPAGLYRIDPANVDPDAQPVPLDDFFPVGHLVITPEGAAVATAMDADRAVGSYTRLVLLRLPNVLEAGRILLPAAGSDDIAILPPTRRRFPMRIAVVVDSERAKSVLVYDAGGSVVGPPDGAVVHEGGSAVSLLAVNRVFAAAVADEYAVRLVDPDGALVPDYLLPTHVGPVSMAASGRTVAVLNYVSNTLSVADVDAFTSDFRVDLDALARYRTAMLGAFADLLGGLLQYLKDGFFHHFLVRCPEPTGDETLWLGSVSIRAGQVHRVCNFARRRYVKSFPTVGYWLSAVPVLPLLRHRFAREACRVLVDGFARRSFDSGEDASDRVSVEALQGFLAWAQAVDLPGRVGRVRTRASAVPRTVAPALARVSLRPTPRGGPVLTAADVGRPVEDVLAALAGRGVAVSRHVTEEVDLSSAVGDLPRLLRDVHEGDRVTLYEDDGAVRWFSVTRGGGTPATPPASPAPADDASRDSLAARLAALEQEVAALRAAVRAEG